MNSNTKIIESGVLESVEVSINRFIESAYDPDVRGSDVVVNNAMVTFELIQLEDLEAADLVVSIFGHESNLLLVSSPLSSFIEKMNPFSMDGPDTNFIVPCIADRALKALKAERHGFILHPTVARRLIGCKFR